MSKIKLAITSIVLKMLIKELRGCNENGLYKSMLVKYSDDCIGLKDTSIDDKSIFNTLLTTSILQKILRSRFNINKSILDEMELLTQKSLSLIDKNITKDYKINFTIKNKELGLYPDDVDDLSLAFLCEIQNKKIKITKSYTHSTTRYNSRTLNLKEFIFEYIKTLNKLRDNDGRYNTWILDDLNKSYAWTDIDPIVHTNIFDSLYQINSIPNSLSDYIKEIVNITEDGQTPLQPKLLSKYYHNDLYKLFRLSIISRDIGAQKNFLEEQGLNVNKMLYKIFFSNAECLLSNKGCVVKWIDILTLTISTISIVKNQKLFLHISSAIYLYKQDANSSHYAVLISYYMSIQMQTASRYHDLIYRKIQKEDIRYGLVEDICKQSESDIKDYFIEQFIEPPSKIQNITNWIMEDTLCWFFSFYKINVVTNINRKKIMTDLKIVTTSMLYGWASYIIKDDFQDGDIGGYTDLRTQKTYEIISDDLLTKHVKCMDSIIYKTLNKRSDKNDFKNEEIIKNVSYQSIVEEINVFINKESGIKKTLTMDSMIHCIGPIVASMYAIFIVHFQSNASKVKKFDSIKGKTLTYYKNFLAIRQLSDDAKDCLEDIKAGRKTVVTEYLEKKLPRKLSLYTDSTEDQRDLYLAYLKHIPDYVYKLTFDFAISARKPLGDLQKILKLPPYRFEYQYDQVDKYVENAYQATLESYVYLRYQKEHAPESN
jgi:hypothetical protein